jgi:integrase
MKLQLHIYPALGAIRLDTITTKCIDDFISKKLSCGRVGGGALSAKYVADMVMLLKSMGKFAEYEHGYNNPFKSIESPTVHRKELSIPPKNEQAILRKFLLKNLSCRNLGILPCLFTGIRIGELCSLTWADVDLFEQVIRINKTVQRVKSFDGESRTALVITPPKSNKSNREIPIPDFLLSLLIKCRKPPDSYILSGNDKIVEPRLMQYYFKAVLKKANLPSMNFHQTRHIFATNCLICGFDIKTLSEILGHSTIELTLNRYAHSSKERKRECMEKLRLIS